MVENIKLRSVVRPSDDDVAAWVDTLSSADGVERHAARVQLEEIGKQAAPALLTALRSPSRHARWEAAKALGEIADPGAAPVLVDTLEDEESAVRWLAATALINLGRDALVPLLQGLETHADSLWFREGAHHVLHSLVRDGVADEVLPVLDALENLEPRVEAPIAAYHVLRNMRTMP